MAEKKEIRVRMAPSPTGLMHIGTLRTVLYDYLFAKKNSGTLVLRIEDTDQSREVEGSVENLLQMLQWAGIEHDEGPQLDAQGKIIEVGSYGPYTQSKRLETYQEHVGKLIDSGHAYHCFCTPERLDAMRKEQQKMKQPPMYDRSCASLEIAEVLSRIDGGEKYVVRMRVPRGETVIVDDIVRGKVSFSTNTVDDQVIMKSDGFPTYHLAVVVDDHLMKISHVFRGEEWLPSTPKHILLYNMFGWDVPAYAHLPLLLAADGKKKLSKRDGDVSVEDFQVKGYLPEAVINFVAFLGWNPGGGETREIYNLQELVEAFQIEKVHKAGAVFDFTKLGKINAQYIKQLSVDELYEKSREFFEKNTAELYPQWSPVNREAITKKILIIEQERLEVFAESAKENSFFFGDIVLDSALLKWKESTDEQTKEALSGAAQVLSDITEEGWTRENLAEKLMAAAGEDRGGFLWPLRAALTGEKRSPSPMDCAWVLGKAETLKRIDKAQMQIT